MMKVIRWLIEKNALSGLAGALLVAIVVPITGWLFSRASSFGAQTSLNLCINVPHELAAMPFIVRHVRDGAGDSPPGGLSYKEDLPFPPPDRSTGEICRRLTFPSHVGVMFKVYVKYEGMSFDTVKHILENAGFKDVSPDDQERLHNAWFLIPGYAKVVHGKNDIVDNFHLD